jgi:ribose transport system substrate-binding protein
MSRAEKSVAVVLHMIRDQPWAAMVIEDLQTSLASSPEIRLHIADPHGDSAEQVRLLDSYLHDRVDALIVLPIDDSAVPTLQKYRSAGIPVIVLDNDMGRPELYQALILADNRHFGQRVGEFFVDALSDHGDVVEIRGIPSSSAARDRSEGLRAAFADHPKIRIVEECVGGWLYARAFREFAAVLTRHPRLDGVMAQNDEMARAAYDAAAAVKREHEMLFTGVDALRGELGGLKLVMQGKLAATIVYPSSGGKAALALRAALSGQTEVPKILLKTSLFRSNECVREWRQRRRSLGS